MELPTFEIFLKQRISAADYENLAELLKEKGSDILKSPHRITKIKNNPALLDEYELIALSKLTKETPEWLVENYSCGKLGIKSEILNAIVQTSNATSEKYKKISEELLEVYRQNKQLYEENRQLLKIAQLSPKPK